MSNEASGSTAPAPSVTTVSVRQQLQRRSLLLVGSLCVLLAPVCQAQRIGARVPSDAAISVLANERADLVLPDAPTAPTPEAPVGFGGLPRSDVDRTVTTHAPKPAASPTDKYIAPGQVAPKQKLVDKILLGLKDAGSAKTIFAATVAAGISHANDSSPNFGRNSTAYAQRFGAGMARGGSYSIFSDSIMASLLHQDPRYYRLGKSHKVAKRLAYAVTRPLIGRTDSGHLMPNISLVVGHAGGAYLTKLYYPENNTSNSEILETFGFSFMGSAIEYGVNEFLSGALNIVHNSRAIKD
jgi:hypothetical protein